MRNTERATKVSQMIRQLEGEKQRRQLLFYIEDHPALSAYEIAQGLNWTTGKVSYHLKTLFNQGEIRRESIASNPHHKKKYFVVEWDQMVNWDEIDQEKHPKSE